MSKYPGKPFLRWAGGKRRIVHNLINLIPPTFDRYIEPFLGGGALFFSLGPSEAILSDSNEDLIDCYKYVKDNPRLVYRYLNDHSSKTSEDYYYSIREQYNRARRSVAQSARFIYLNKTCFNGIFRVNLNGEFNVPYGHKEPPVLPSLEELLVASRLLNRVSLSSGSYDEVINKHHPRQGDFIYFDPPYPPLNQTSFFTHYTKARFSWGDHKKVSEVAHKLDIAGSLVMVSNADTEAVKQLYPGWHHYPLPVVRWISANGNRYKVSELVITNYPIEFASS